VAAKILGGAQKGTTPRDVIALSCGRGGVECISCEENTVAKDIFYEGNQQRSLAGS